MRIYKAHEVDNQRFYQVPKSLFSNLRYKGLSLEAKMTYAFIRDRMELSKKNGWINEEGEIYLLFSRESIADLLDVSITTVTKTFKEMAKYELIYEKRQGQGRPNILFVCHSEVDNEEISENHKNCDSRINKNCILKSRNLLANDTNYSDTELSETDHNDKGSNSGEVATNFSKNINKEVIQAISTYTNDLYVRKTGKQHPKLKLQQHRQIYENISIFMDEYGLDCDAMVDMMVKFLNSNIRSDWNINHFATEGMMINRMYEVAY